jgi:xylan 1,4-beta-xylosidase
MAIRSVRSLAVALMCASAAGPALADGAELRIDFTRTNGVIRALHGVNLGPLCYRGTVDLSAYHRELAIPLTRVHDVVWLNAEAVDIHTIFPDFRNDPGQPENYDFRQTDDYLQAIVDVGSQIVYRLGESIEHTPRKYRVNPPVDPEKWAAVCLGILRHYNEGWAGGSHHGIRYWEIWNEPDVRPAMWTGTDEQFFRLYEVTANAIKTRFPDVKVGGPAVGGTGEFVGGSFQPATFLTNFLAFCHERRVPLDFFSWHRYTSDPWDLPRRAGAVRRVLDRFGFAGTESHLNEWNYLPGDDWRPLLKEGQGEARRRWYGEMGGPRGAAFAAAGLMLLQDAPVEAAAYYTGEIQGFGLFNFEGVPKKTFYAFKGFRALLETPVRVAMQLPPGLRLVGLAGVDVSRTRAALLLSNPSDAPERLNLVLDRLPAGVGRECRILSVDAGHDLTEVRREALASKPARVPVDLPGQTVLLIRIGFPGKPG